MSVQDVLRRLKSVQHVRRMHWTARCPAHVVRRPKLSISARSDGRVFLRCAAGCHPSDVLDALGLTLNGVVLPEANFMCSMAIGSLERVECAIGSAVMPQDDKFRVLGALMQLRRLHRLLKSLEEQSRE